MVKLLDLRGVLHKHRGAAVLRAFLGSPLSMVNIAHFLTFVKSDCTFSLPFDAMYVILKSMSGFAEKRPGVRLIVYHVRAFMSFNNDWQSSKIIDALSIWPFSTFATFFQ